MSMWMRYCCKKIHHHIIISTVTKWNSTELNIPVSGDGDLERLCWYVNDNLRSTDDMLRVFTESMLPIS